MSILAFYDLIVTRDTNITHISNKLDMQWNSEHANTQVVWDELWHVQSLTGKSLAGIVIL